MDLSMLFDNLMHPPVLFFFLGMAAVLLGSDLQIPPAIGKFLSLYLLFDIGIRGGEELFHSGFGLHVVKIVIACMTVSFLLPFASYRILRIRLDPFNAGAVAATYGSISAVTFATAMSFLETMNIKFGGYMVAGMALMESPAIVAGLLLIRVAMEPDQQQDTETKPAHVKPSGWRHTLHEAFFNGSVLLLVGSLIIGYASGTAGEEELRPFVSDIFKGMLSLYMLDMGILAGGRLGALRESGVFLSGFALLFPVVVSLIGIGLSAAMGLDIGDALLFTVLCASASYIAVPAAMRLAVPQANMSILLPMSLGLTFSLNVTLGIPLYYTLIHMLWT